MQKEDEVSEQLYKIMKEIGFSEQEMRLYTLSLSLGPSLVSKLAKSMGISRPNIYKVILGLEEKGLTSFSSQRKYNRKLLVESPSRIAELLQGKRDSLKKLNDGLSVTMPNLMSLWEQGSLPTKVHIASGVDQYLRLMDMMINESHDPIMFYGSIQDMIGLISRDEEKKWVNRRVRRGVLIKTLLFPSEDATRLESSDKKELRETRILKNIPTSSASFELFGNKMVLWQPKAKLAVLIEDEYIVTMFRGIFERLWEGSK